MASHLWINVLIGVCVYCYRILHCGSGSCDSCFRNDLPAADARAGTQQHARGRVRQPRPLWPATFDVGNVSFHDPW